jgi:hypothetical protein
VTDEHEQEPWESVWDDWLTWVGDLHNNDRVYDKLEQNLSADTIAIVAAILTLIERTPANKPFFLETAPR